MPVVIESPEDPQFALYANLLKTLRKNSGYPIVAHVYTEEPTIDFRALAEDFRELYEEPIKIKRMDKTQAIFSMMGCQISIRRLKTLPPIDDFGTRLESLWACQVLKEDFPHIYELCKYGWVVSLIPDIVTVKKISIELAAGCFSYWLSTLQGATGEGQVIIDTTSSINTIETFCENSEDSLLSSEFPIGNWVSVVQLKDGEGESWFQTIGLTKLGAPECLIRAKNGYSIEAEWLCYFMAQKFLRELWGLTTELALQPDSDFSFCPSPVDKDLQVIFFANTEETLEMASEDRESLLDEDPELS